MTLTHFVIFACVVYLAIVFGRMSAKNDMRRRFASIDEGQNFSDVESVINYILNLRDQVETLLTDKKALTNSLNIARVGSEKLERDYKVLLAQLKEKREKCEKQEMQLQSYKDKIKDKDSKITEIFMDFNSWMSELWKSVTAINENACEHGASISGYCNDMDKTRKKLIYATGLMNKTYLLSIGQVEVLKNGSLKYSLGSRSLGNYANKENQGWCSYLNPMGVLPLINPRDSKPIALITDYWDYQKLAKKFSEVNKTSANIISESAKMLDYMRDIKPKFEKLIIKY